MDIIKEFKYREPIDNIFYELSPYKDSSIRRSKIILIKSVMRNYEGYRSLSSIKQLRLLINVEKSCFNSSVIKSIEKNIIPTWKSQQLINIYHDICYRVSISLDCKSELKSDFLIKWIIESPTNANHVGIMLAEELCPNNNVEIRKKSRLRLEQKIELKTTSIYTCENCGKDEIIIKRVQLRSQDEGSSTICTCKYCKHHWIYW